MALLITTRWAMVLGLCALGGCSIDRETGRFPTQSPPDTGAGAIDFGPLSDAGTDDAGVPSALTDPAGQWMLFVEDRNCLVDAGDPVESIIWTWYLVDIEPQESGRAALTLRSHICKQILSPLAFGFLSVVPDRVVDAGETQRTGAFLVGDEAGALFLADTIVDYWGVEGLSVADAIPDEPIDPRIIDQDGDGNPGVTLPVTTRTGGPLCEVFVAQRIRVALEGQVRNARRIEGVAASGTDKAILAASTDLCASGDVVPNMAGNRFVLVRVDGVDGAPDADRDGDGTIECPELRVGVEGVMAAYGIERSAPDSETWCGR